MTAAVAVAALAGASASGAAVGVGHSGWFWGNPLPQGHSLYALGGAGPALYAAGEFGTVLRSDDAGGSWTGLPSGTTASLRQVDVLDADSLVVGGGCTLRRSDDGGRRFTRLPFTSSDRRCASDVAAFDFVAGGNGYIALQNGTLLQTPDGGNTFSQRSAVPGTSAGGGPSTPSALAFTEPQTGVAITGNGPGAIYRTTNGASSWTQVAPSGPALAGLHFPTPAVGYAAGSDNTLLRSVDGGATWERRPLAGVSGSAALTSVRCSGPDVCLMTVAGGERLLRTIDGGATATSVSAANGLLRTVFSSPARAVAVGTARRDGGLRQRR